MISNAVDSARSVFGADIDGDGDLDALSASSSDNKIAWYENRLNEAAANFSPPRVISTAANRAYSVFAADLDGDGDPDVLSASNNDDKIAWYENVDGAGSFGPQQVITVDADGAASVFAVDMDGDGDFDVLSASNYDDSIAWYENMDGTGSFGPPQLISVTAEFANSVFAADLDGDGDADVIWGGAERIAWAENRLDEPTADIGPEQVIKEVAVGVRSVSAVDLDEDRHLDALAGGSEIHWYANPGTDPHNPDSDGDGLSDGDEVHFYQTDPLDLDSDGDGLLDFDEVNVHATDPASLDTDGDGLSDGEELNVLATDPLNPDSDGDGMLDRFEVENSFNPLLAGDELQDPDLDGLDNLAEQSAGSDPHDPDTDRDSLPDGSEVNVHLTDPAKSDTEDDGLRDDFEIAHGFNPLIGGEQLQDPDLDGLVNLGEQAARTNPHDADTDDDGLSDGEEASRVRTVRFGSVRGGTIDTLIAASLVTSDLDRDGDHEVVAAAWGSGIRWYENLDGAGNFSSYRVLSDIAASSIFAIDLDGDRAPDVLSSYSPSNEVAWYRNRLHEASADFGPQQVITTVALSARSVHAADLDGDGDPDALSASFSDNTIAWYENRLNEASGDFGPPREITRAAHGAYSVYAKDLDGDGDPDVLSANKSDDTIVWYENRLNEASADFGPQQVITTLASDATSVIAADVDLDGDPDVLSSSWQGGKIAWYENHLDEPSANFGPQQVITTSARGANMVFAADLDGDGDPDALSASHTDCCGGRNPLIAWYENRVSEASADFGPLQGLGSAARGMAPAAIAADLDGDGFADFLASTSFTFAERIHWYGNPGTDPNNPDSDGDGLLDGAEVNLYATDPSHTDSDRDGLLDGDEINVYATNPAKRDTDGDGLWDGDEVNVHGTNPNHADTDGDGLLDSYELAKGFDPLVGGEETQDPDLDGLDNLGEQAAGTDPFNADSDGDRLLDGAEVVQHGTNPLDSDSDNDGFFDDAEISAGTDPNNANDHPGAGARLPMLYKGNLSLYRAYGIPCGGRSCYSYYYERPLGRPLVGSDTTYVTLDTVGAPAGFALRGGKLTLETPSLSRTLPAVQNGSVSIGVRTHPNASLANDSGFFGPGGGPGSHSFAYYQTTTMSGGISTPRWRITPGANQFGGTLRLLGAIDEMRDLRLTSSGTVDFYAHAPDPFSALGGRCTATTGCPSLPVSHASRIVQYYTSLKNLYTTALVNAWGYAWTTGRVYVKAFDNAYLDTKVTRTGYDNRTSLGQGVVQLVSPHIAHWDFATLPLDRATGAIAILNIEIRFVPEPKAWLMLVSGVGLLGVLYRRRH